MDITPCTPGGFGAEIGGLDLSAPLPPEVGAILRRALDDHRLLVFRGQSLSPEAQVRFARTLGDVEPPEASGVLSTHFDAVPELQWLSYLRADGSEPTDNRPSQADVWHADYTYLDDPPEFACLFGQEIPVDGPDTLYVDMQGAHAAMPADLAARVAEARAIHQQRGGLDPTTYRLPPYLSPGQTDDGSAYREAIHPLVSRHPVTGRPGFYMAQCYMLGIEGMEPADGRALIDDLYTHVTQEHFVHRHVWRAGDVVVWDNFATNHRRSKPLDRPRVLHRVTIRRVRDLAGRSAAQ